MSPVIDCTTDEGLAQGIAAAADAVRRGELVVLPTDTVYGVGADAFSAEAVAAILAAKGRGREMPPPVLIPNPRTVDGLATHVPDYARDLIAAFWPGPLTLVLYAQASLMWDLGDTNGTVPLRMPQNDTVVVRRRDRPARQTGHLSAHGRTQRVFESQLGMRAGRSSPAGANA